MTGNHRNSGITRRRALAVTLEPYAKHSGSYTTLDNDMVYDGSGASSGLLTLDAVHKKDPSKGYKGSLTLGVDPEAENTGAGGGDGGTPPSGAPSSAPTGTPPSGTASPSVSPTSSASASSASASS
ncbi:hypothetical protein [Streptomyces cellulosae]